MKRIFLPVIAMLMLVLASCASPGPVEVNSGSYENISIETLQSMMAERRDSFLLINTHIPFEGNIPDTDLSIPFDEITDNLHLLPEDKNAEILLYCRSDSMSHAASADLVAAGYTNVKTLVGGLTAWGAAGLPIELEP